MIACLHGIGFIRSTDIWLSVVSFPYRGSDHYRDGNRFAVKTARSLPTRRDIGRRPPRIPADSRSASPQPDTGAGDRALWRAVPRSRHGAASGLSD